MPLFGVFPIFLMDTNQISAPYCYLASMAQEGKVNLGKFMSKAGSAGHRARVPPDPIPNSEVKPRSVPRCIVVFGHENLGKLATPKPFS